MSLSSIVTIVSLSSSVIAVVTTIVISIRKVDQIRRKSTFVIGVVGDKYPNIVNRIPNFLSVKHAVRSSSSVVVVHFKKLSHALRFSNVVCCIEGEDPKIFSPDDAVWDVIYKSKVFDQEALEKQSNIT